MQMCGENAVINQRHHKTYKCSILYSTISSKLHDKICSIYKYIFCHGKLVVSTVTIGCSIYAGRREST